MYEEMRKPHMSKAFRRKLIFTLSLPSYFIRGGLTILRRFFVNFKKVNIISPYTPDEKFLSYASHGIDVVCRQDT
jgi:hypothetical protein